MALVVYFFGAFQQSLNIQTCIKRPFLSLVCDVRMLQMLQKLIGRLTYVIVVNILEAESIVPKALVTWGTD